MNENRYNHDHNVVDLVTQKGGLSTWPCTEAYGRLAVPQGMTHRETKRDSQEIPWL